MALYQSTMSQHASVGGKVPCHPTLAWRHRPPICRALRHSMACTHAAGRGVETTSGIDARSMYQQQTYSPPALASKVEPAFIAGRGLGLLATQDISTGELILLSRPLGVAYGPVGSAPSNEAVVKAIIKAPLQPADLQWLKLLSASRAPQSSSESCISDARSRSSDAQADTLAAVADLLKQRGQQSPAATAGEQGFEASNVLQLSALPDQQLVAEAVSCNSYGEASEDIAVATLREVEPLAFTGLWPELALINHSCAPNTSQLVVGGSMLLRAAHPILEGEEVTTCYLAQSRFLHVASRRSQLMAEYGFHCQCDRCLVEHHLFPTRRYPLTDTAERHLARSTLSARSPSSPAISTINRVMQWAVDKVFGPGRYSVGTARNNSILQELNTLLKGNLEASAQDALTALSAVTNKQQAVLQRVEAAIARVEAEVAALELSKRDRLALLASVGGLYTLRHELLEVSGLGSPEQQLDALQALLDVVDAVARGSDIHAFLAVKYQAKARAVHGGGTEQSNKAELACAAAHYARYGKVDAGLLRELMQVRVRLSAGSNIASRISLMAWKAALEDSSDPLQP